MNNPLSPKPKLTTEKWSDRLVARLSAAVVLAGVAGLSWCFYTYIHSHYRFGDARIFIDRNQRIDAARELGMQLWESHDHGGIPIKADALDLDKMQLGDADATGFFRIRGNFVLVSDIDEALTRAEQKNQEQKRGEQVIGMELHCKNGWIVLYADLRCSCIFDFEEDERDEIWDTWFQDGYIEVR